MDATTARVAAPRFKSDHPELDFLLGNVADAIQLSPPLYKKAEEHYRAVGRWLSDPKSPFAALSPRVFAQGSMALGTTVSPWGRVEYDVDVVFEVTGGQWTARTLFDAMCTRLRENGNFAPLLAPSEQSRPCARLEYRGDFHLDIIPAVRGISGMTRPWLLEYATTGVLVPKPDLTDWQPSNPEGFVKWFNSRAVKVRRDWLIEAKLEPLPAQTEAEDKAPLAVAVQLLKRARDVAFNGKGIAPRSIVLTTLAGKHYVGGESVTDIIQGILRGIRAEIWAAGGSIISVPNPTNVAENFADSMKKEGQDALDGFAQNLGTKLAAMQQPGIGIDRLKNELEKVFGEDPAGRAAVDSAVRKLAERHKAARDAGALTYSPAAGLSVVQTTGSHHAPRNTNYGD
jgi:hypothetical protein